MSELEPSELIRLVLDSKETTETLKKDEHIRKALILPNSNEKIKEKLASSLDDLVFQIQDNNKFRRVWDDFVITFEEEENKLLAGDGEFKVFSRFEIDTDGLKCSVLIVEDYGEPLHIDDFAKISNGIKAEIKLISQKVPKLTVDAKGQEVQSFYADVESRLAGHLKSHPDYMDELEGLLLESLGGLCEDSDAEIQDKILLDKMESLDLAEADEKSKAEEILDEASQTEAKELLDKLEETKMPKDKLQIVLDLSKMCSEKIQSHEKVVNADMLLPVLMLALIKARPKHFISDLRYIQRFRNHSKLTGEVAYNLTNVLAVVSLIQGAQVDKINEKGESIYTLVSRSTSHVKMEDGEHKSTPESPSMLMRPLSELSNVFTKVTTYPRAFSSAVVDSFRRSRTVEEMPSPRPVGSKWVERAIKHPETGEPMAEEDVEIRAFRHRILSLEKYDEMSVKEIPMMFADYKKLLMTFQFEPAKQDKK